MTKESAAVAKDLMSFAKVRAVDKINARFCVVDDKEVMFMVMDDKEVHPSYDVGIWANTPYFASALSGMYNMAWKNMKDGSAALKALK